MAYEREQEMRLLKNLSWHFSAYTIRSTTSKQNYFMKLLGTFLIQWA